MEGKRVRDKKIWSNSGIEARQKNYVLSDQEMPFG